MPAAIAIPLVTGAVSAGAQIYGAKKASDASKKASKAQQDASDKAFQYQKQERDRMSGLNAPFMQGMGDRVNTLRSLTTPGQVYMPPQMRPMPGPPPGQMPGPQPMPQQGPPRGPVPMTMGQMRQPMPMGPDPYQQYLQSRMGG